MTCLTIDLFLPKEHGINKYRIERSGRGNESTPRTRGRGNESTPRTRGRGNESMPRTRGLVHYASYLSRVTKEKT